MFRLQTTMVLQSYPICFRIFCFVCLHVSGFFLLCQFGCHLFHRCEFFCFLCFLIRISIMTASCFFFAWLGFIFLLRHTPMFFLSQYHAIESVRVPILLVTNRFFGMWQKCVCEQSAPQMRTNWNAFASAFRCSSTVCLFVKESLLVNFFVLLQHLCCLYYGTREVNFFCFVFIIGLFNDSSFMKTKNTTWFSIRNNI